MPDPSPDSAPGKPSAAQPDAAQPAATELTAPPSGPIGAWLSSQGFDHQALGTDHVGVELIGVEPLFLPALAAALKAIGFDYLQCQGGYDEGAGGNLVSFYHLVKLGAGADPAPSPGSRPEEVRLKVFLPRDGTLSIPSLYGLFRGADWQERETFDMYGIAFEGHPHPKRLLMPEDWKGYPLRKDYVQPDFYELQDAY